MTRPDWDLALRAELVAAARRRASAPARRLRRVEVALVSLVAAALLLAPSPARAQVEVERVGTDLVVRLLDLEIDPHRVEAELRAAGLEASVETVPVGPSAVGRFVGTLATGPQPRELVPLDRSGTSFAAFRLPVGWRGHLHLFVGRPANPGEGYVAFADALAPGEPLACRDLVGRPAAEVVDTVEAVEADTTFRRLTAPDAPPLRPDDLRGPLGRWRVHRADAVDDVRVVLWLGPPEEPVPSRGRPAGCPR